MNETINTPLHIALLAPTKKPDRAPEAPYRLRIYAREIALGLDGVLTIKTGVQLFAPEGYLPVYDTVYTCGLEGRLSTTIEYEQGEYGEEIVFKTEGLRLSKKTKESIAELADGKKPAAEVFLVPTEKPYDIFSGCIPSPKVSQEEQEQEECLNALLDHHVIFRRDFSTLREILSKLHEDFEASRKDHPYIEEVNKSLRSLRMRYAPNEDELIIEATRGNMLYLFAGTKFGADTRKTKETLYRTPGISTARRRVHGTARDVIVISGSVISTL